MAFYKDVPNDHPRKKNYANQGSWDDEGTHYNSAGSRRFGPNSDKSEQGYRSNNGRGGERRYGNDRRSNDGERRYGNDRRSNDGERRYGNDHRNNDGERRFERKDNRSFDRKPQENRRPAETAPRSYKEFEHRAPVSYAPAAPAAPAVPVEEQIDRMENVLVGRNPIREAIRNGRDIEKLLVQKGELSGSAREIVQMAREARIQVQEVEKIRLDEIAPHHQGMLAYASAYQYSSVEAMLAAAKEKDEDPFLILLDGVTDPHNLGAIIRSAECCGAHGVIVPERRSVGLTPAAVKASAGAVEHMKVARVVNLNRTIEELKKQGVWTYAVTMDGVDYEKVNFKGGVALVIGAEGEGISRLTLENCDQRVSLPMAGHIDSLNASVAAGVMMYRVLSSRRA